MTRLVIDGTMSVERRVTFGGQNCQPAHPERHATAAIQQQQQHVDLAAAAHVRLNATTAFLHFFKPFSAGTLRWSAWSCSLS